MNEYSRTSNKPLQRRPRSAVLTPPFDAARGPAEWERWAYFTYYSEYQLGEDFLCHEENNLKPNALIVGKNQ